MQEDLLNAETTLDARTVDLRRNFDDAFQAPPRGEAEATIDLLTVTIGEELLAVLVAHVAHVQAHPIIVSVPDAPRGCLGVAGHRGKLVAVFDLAQLLGHAATNTHGIMLISRANPSIGFAVSTVDRYRRVPRSAIASPLESGDGVHLGTLVDGAHKAPAISLAMLVAALESPREGAPT